MFKTCLKIFMARILDVSLGTVKTFFIFRENKFVSFVISFFEVLVWYFAARTALSTISNSLYIPIAYSLGYASGTYIGTFISSRYIRGYLTVNVISNKISYSDLDIIKKMNFGVSCVNTFDDKKYLIIETSKSRLSNLKRLILGIDSDAFIFINDTRVVHNGFFYK